MSTTPFSSTVADLYRDHHGWLHGWLRKKLGCSHHAADVAQDTYLRIIDRGYAPEREESRRHLARIANGLVIDLFRRRHIETTYLAAIALLPEPELPSPEACALVVEALIEIDAVLAGMPDKVRRAFLLCKLDGLSYREIAVQLDVSVSSVEKYVARALAACYLSLYSEDDAS